MPSDEAEFNRWYDHEHLEERVAIPGFLEARRYVAHDGNPKYLSLYSTETFDVLDSAAYRTALANQTAWSKANIARFKNMIRAVARITISRGQGRGAALRHYACACVPRTKRIGCVPHLRDQLEPGEAGRNYLDAPARKRCFVVQSRSPTIPSVPQNPGAGDWFVLIDDTDVKAVSATIAARLGDAAIKSAVISTGLYYLIAYMINWKSNVFPGVLGRTCDRPCEPACRRGRVEDDPGRDLPPEARRRRLQG